jgi:hypothetical protein
MPSINLPFLRELRDNYETFPCFIETGTYNGETTFEIEPYFDKVYTIEYSEKLHNRTKSKYTGNKIKFLLGDSSIVFETLLPTIEDKCIFFLDGHWSHCDTGKSSKDCPLEEEISHINNLFKNEAIIIIDDYRLFGLDRTNEGGEDWSQINKKNLLDILQDRISQEYHLDSSWAKDDRLVIHIKPLIQSMPQLLLSPPE